MSAKPTKQNRRQCDSLVLMGRTGATTDDLEALYREKYSSLVRVASAICGDQEAGRDAVQSAFVAAVTHRRSFRRTGSLQAWVWQIVVNEARKSSRTRTLWPRFVAEQGQEPGRNGHEDRDDPLGVGRWIAALPPRQREVVFLRYFADLDYRTIARVLDLETGTVSATLSAAHKTLRTRLEANQR